MVEPRLDEVLIMSQDSIISKTTKRFLYKLHPVSQLDTSVHSYYWLVCCWQASSAGAKVEKVTTDLIKYLKEGVLQEEFILDNIPRLMGLMRDANVTLRWTMLHCASLQTGGSAFIYRLMLLCCGH